MLMTLNQVVNNEIGIAGYLLLGWPGCYINLQHCRGLSLVHLQLGNICEEKGISSWYRVSILSRYNLSC